MPLARVLRHIRCEPPGLSSGPLRDRGAGGPEIRRGGAGWGRVRAPGGGLPRRPGLDGEPGLALFRAWLDQASSMS